MIIVIILKNVPLADPPSVGTTGKSLLDLVTRSPHPHHLRGGQDLELAPFCKICNFEKEFAKFAKLHQFHFLQHYHYEDKTGWGPARDRCKENNGDLVVVNSEKENM